jgi:predicted DNA binding protein
MMTLSKAVKIANVKAPPREDKRNNNRLTPKEWAEAEVLWASGEWTEPQIGKKFGITTQAIHTHMKKHGVKKSSLAEEHKKRVLEEVTRQATMEASVAAARVRETKEEHYKMSSAIAKLAWNEVLTAKQNGSPVSVAMNNLKALDAAMNVMTKARQERWAVLGLDRPDAVDTDSLPELLVSELTAEQIEALRNRDDSGFEDLPSDAVQLASDDADADDAVVEE